MYYTYDPKTKEPTGTSEVKTDYCTEWKPPKGPCFFDGFGWVALDVLNDLARENLIISILKRDQELTSTDEDYSVAEQSTFYAQALEAELFLENAKAKTPLLDMLLLKGEDKKQLVDKILKKRDESFLAGAKARKLRKTRLAELRKLSDKELQKIYFT